MPGSPPAPSLSLASTATPAVRGWLAVASLLAVAAPFVCVHFLPVTDLPQHLAQVRLLVDAITSANGAYRVQWDTPYSFVYLPLSAAWAIFEPLTAGRVGMLTLGLLWTLAAHGLAAERWRAPESAVLVSIVFFNHAVYWGFLSFVCGWPVFVVWLLLIIRRPDDVRPRHLSILLLTAAVLYASHVLWLVAAVVWLVVHGLIARVPRRALLLQVASVMPVLVALALWYPRLQTFSGPTEWLSTPTGRLSYGWLVDSTFGGIAGPTEIAVGAALLLWVGAGVWQHRSTLRSACDPQLLLAGALLGAAAFFLPTLYSNTFHFGERWWPPAAILLILAAPAPRLRPRLARLAVIAVVAGFSLTTALTWRQFEREDLAGLSEALATLPEHARVVGLDYLQTSRLTKGRPFLQTFAYAQALKGGELNFSFAEFAPSLVVYRAPRRTPWNRGIEWDAARMRADDLRYFDYALVNGDDPLHQALAANSRLRRRTSSGRWRLYQVEASP